jgi:hypothetical protein
MLRNGQLVPDAKVKSLEASELKHDGSDLARPLG